MIENVFLVWCHSPLSSCSISKPSHNEWRKTKQKKWLSWQISQWEMVRIQSFRLSLYSISKLTMTFSGGRHFSNNRKHFVNCIFSELINYNSHFRLLHLSENDFIHFGHFFYYYFCHCCYAILNSLMLRVREKRKSRLVFGHFLVQL